MNHILDKSKIKKQATTQEPEAYLNFIKIRFKHFGDKGVEVR